MLAFYTAVPMTLRSDHGADTAPSVSRDYERRLARQVDPGARTMTLAALALLERMVRGAGFGSRSLAVLEYPEGGAPYWPEGPAFSLSHTEGLVACAIAAQPDARIGIDVERVRPFDRRSLRCVRALAGRLTEVDDPVSSLAAWTQCEAALKAAGASMRRIDELRLDPDGRQAGLGARSFSVRPLMLPDGYVGSLAAETATIELESVVAD